MHATLFRGWLAVARAGLGDVAAATDDLEELVRGLPGEHRLRWLPIVGNLAEVATALSDRKHAGVLYDELSPYRGQVVAGMAAHCLGSVDRHLGMLATVLERWDVAQAHFDEALRVDAGLRSPPLLAHTQLWYGSLLTHRPGGDHARAAALLEAASAAAERLGMPAIAAQVDELRRTT